MAYFHPRNESIALLILQSKITGLFKTLQTLNWSLYSQDEIPKKANLSGITGICSISDLYYM